MAELSIEPILTPLLALAGEEKHFREYFDMAQGFLGNVAAGKLDEGWRGFLDYRNGPALGKHCPKRRGSAFGRPQRAL